MMDKIKRDRAFRGRFAVAPDETPKTDKMYASRLLPEQAAQIDAIAAEREMPVGAVVRELLGLALQLDQRLLQKCPSIDWANEAIHQRLKRNKLL